MQGLGHRDAQEVVEEAGEGAPGRVRVAAQAVQEHVPAHTTSHFVGASPFVKMYFIDNPQERTSIWKTPFCA